ncbi:alpha/beta fold hydrolase [uncultured Photobacterium sp.]|uniref:alpha/beta fold hydrolase n=1 Tax=uncultured Photobacterium sp. TaxID=173973 RepID=UPI00261EBA29|nr:alpha/beta fold hydrolase [uncultured Photobacterium sp.]
MYQIAKEAHLIQNSYVKYQLNIDSDSKESTILVVLMADRFADQVNGFDAMIGQSEMTVHTTVSDKFLFIFDDRNMDLHFQPSEPYSLVELEPSSDLKIGPVILSNSGEYPHQLIGKSLKKVVNIQVSIVASGEVTDLSDSRFSEKQAEIGLWKPYTFFENGNSGLFFLSDFDSSKIPVLFIHGMKGTPREFASIIESIDRSRYQVWVVNYPSAVPLLLVSQGLNNMMSWIRKQYHFNGIHIVAHSMGGLVSKAYINQCTRNRTCNDILSFTSISSPFGGNKAASKGTKFAPVVVPSWYDLDPEGDFIKSLFAPQATLPPHLLIFGYKVRGVLNVESGDGVISLSSQLELRAQRQAKRIVGFNEDHVSILKNRNIQKELKEFWLNAENG